MAKKIVVVGGGVGGLGAAALLAREGFRVSLIEKNDQIGGKARLWVKDGFRFDMGPSWYLMPEVFENFFTLFGRKRADYYSLTRLDPAYSVYFGNGDPVRVSSEREKVRELFEQLEPGGGKKLEEYLDKAARKYDIAMGEFLYKNYRTLLDFLDRKMLFKGPQLKVFRSLDRVVSTYFSDRRARQILEYGTVFLGTSPKEAPALYSIMSHMDLTQGVYYPRGGLAEIPRSIGRLAQELGVVIATGVEARKITTDANGRATGVSTDGGKIEADAVVVNADYYHAEMQLLEPEYRSYPPSYWRKKVWAPSMFILYLGLNKKLRSLTHHNLYFSPDWDRHFDGIFKKPAWPEDPCFYVSCISKTDDDAAPRGGENVFVLVPVAPGLEDEEEQRTRYADYVVDRLEKVTGEKVKDSISVRRIYSHRDFIRDYNAHRGTALGLAHTLGQTAVFRPSLRSRKVRNLYYTGQYTHPGVGVPMVLIAAQVTSALVKEDSNGRSS